MLTFEQIPMKCADLGLPNVIPDIKCSFGGGNPLPALVDEGMTPLEGAWVAQGNVHCMLPYTMIDGYNRELRDSSLRMAVLENEFLRAEFALDLGGRLWSLFDKKQNRELLFRNNVFQPANLALRNAWFSGGVEWNLGMIGHHAHTASPLFAAHYPNAAGGETLKLYEFERKRGLCYTLRAALADDVLLIRITVENTENRPTYVYWWSNMAVEQHEGTRVIVPADSYYSYEYGSADGRNHAHAPAVPDYGTYPARHSHAFDYFFRIPESRPKFEAAVEADRGDGTSDGFVQFSTANLIGRKLFVWGTESQGGRNWNRWLSHDDRYYAETQAGLLHSQAEQAPMAADSTIEWTEGYAGLSGDAGLFHSENYAEASHYTENLLTLGGRFALVNNADSYFEAAGEETVESYGSGWGALAELYTGRKISALSSFPKESIAEGTPEHDFLTLWETGSLPEKSPILSEGTLLDYAGGAYGGYFLEKLQEIPEKSWYAWLELGCLYYEAKSYDAAEAAFLKSLGKAENPLALTALAKMAAARGKKAEAVALMKRALSAGGEYVRLVIDVIGFVRRFGDPSEVEAIVAEAVAAHPSYLENGRIALMNIQNLVKQGRIDEAEERLLTAPEVSDIREGEVSTSAVWADLYRAKIARDESRSLDEVTAEEAFGKYPIPAEIDFRMG